MGGTPLCGSGIELGSKSKQQSRSGQSGDKHRATHRSKEDMRVITFANLMKKMGVPLILVMGVPGSLDETFCMMIKAKYQFSVITFGSLLAAESHRRVADLEIDFLGIPVSIESMEDLIKMDMVNKAKQRPRGFLLHGFPREMVQAIHFDENVWAFNYILYFDMPDESAIERIVYLQKTPSKVTENYKDDLKMRIQRFHKSTETILEVFKKRMIFINADQEPSKVFAQICDFFEAILGIM